MDMKSLLTQIASGKLNPQQLIQNMLQGRNFTQDKIDQFKAFAKQYGATDEQIEEVLKTINKPKQ